jgi:hypothetical protein
MLALRLRMGIRAADVRQNAAPDLNAIERLQARAPAEDEKVH